jgi:hypothetical protein
MISNEYKYDDYIVELLDNHNKKINIKVKKDDNSNIQYETEISLKNFNNSNNCNDNYENIISYLNHNEIQPQKKSKPNLPTVFGNPGIKFKFEKKIVFEYNHGYLAMNFGKINLGNNTFNSDFVIYLDEINKSIELHKEIELYKEIINYLCESPEIVEKLKNSKYYLTTMNENKIDS